MSNVRRSAQADKAAGGEIRQWELVLTEIRRLQRLGVSVPDIAMQLRISAGLVNQVLLQSYKMTADTVAVFERQEAGVGH